MDAKLSPLVHTHAVRSEVGAELALQAVHAFVWLPRTEKVPAAQAAMMAFVVVVHCVVTRWPAPAIEHVLEHGVLTVLVPYTEGMPAVE